jgi:hypothetical protein
MNSTSSALPSIYNNSGGSSFSPILLGGGEKPTTKNTHATMTKMTTKNNDKPSSVPVKKGSFLDEDSIELDSSNNRTKVKGKKGIGGGGVTKSAMESAHIVSSVMHSPQPPSKSPFKPSQQQQLSLGSSITSIEGGIRPSPGRKITHNIGVDSPVSVNKGNKSTHAKSTQQQPQQHVELASSSKKRSNKEESPTKNQSNNTPLHLHTAMYTDLSSTTSSIHHKQMIQKLYQDLKQVSLQQQQHQHPNTSSPLHQMQLLTSTSPLKSFAHKEEASHSPSYQLPLNTFPLSSSLQPTQPQLLYTQQTKKLSPSKLILAMNEELVSKSLQFPSPRTQNLEEATNQRNNRNSYGEIESGGHGGSDGMDAQTDGQSLSFEELTVSAGPSLELQPQTSMSLDPNGFVIATGLITEGNWYVDLLCYL